MINPTEASGTEQKNHESILVVDDEVSLLHLMQEQLRMEGYQTYIADTAESALEILVEHDDIGLLLSDVMLPDGINGYELAKKATAIRPDLSILFASGYSADAVQEKGMNISQDDILQKPFRHDVLTKTVRHALDKPASSQAFL